MLNKVVLAIKLPENKVIYANQAVLELLYGRLLIKPIATNKRIEGYKHLFCYLFTHLSNMGLM